MSEPALPAASAAWIVGAEATADVSVWGLSPTRRLRRALDAAGCKDVRVLGTTELVPLAASQAVVILRADWIYDDRLIAALLCAESDLVLVADDNTPVATRCSPEVFATSFAALQSGSAPVGLPARRAAELAPAYSARLRKHDPPFLLPARGDSIPAIEARTFSAAYKGATDLVTKWVWPIPARWVTRRLAQAHTHPNTVTLVSWVLAIAAFWAFAEGAYGWGLAAAWGMTFLDTVDGKLARVTLTSSKLGDVLDHSLDLVHPPFWWWAWGAGIAWESHPATWIVIGDYFVGRAIEGAFLAGFGFETHSWRPIDTLFRTITARRNPNLICFTVATSVGRPDIGMLLVAGWTVASLVFHGLRLAQAGLAQRRGEAVEPWDGGASRPAGSD